MRLGFDFVPFPREIWTDNLNLSQSEFRLLGWFCCNLKFGRSQFDMSDDNILSGFTRDGRSYPPVGLSRNSMQSARTALTGRKLLLAIQTAGGGGRGKSAQWSYRLNLSDVEENSRGTSQILTPNLSEVNSFTQQNLSNFDNAIKEVEIEPEGTEKDRALSRIWDYYFTKFKRNPRIYTFTDKRKQQGAARLTECIKKTGSISDAEVMLKQAIDRLAASEFHRANGYTDWEQVFRSQDKFENWFARKGNGNGKQSSDDRLAAELSFFD